MSNTNHDTASNDKEVREAATIINDAAVKQRMAEKIVANSKEYHSTDTVVSDFPTKKSLATKLNQVAPGIAKQINADETATTTGDSDDLQMFGGDGE
jgi:hypothetical protein